QSIPGFRTPEFLLGFLALRDVKEGNDTADHLRVMEDGVRPILDRQKRPISTPEDLIFHIGLPAILKRPVNLTLVSGIAASVGSSMVDKRMHVLPQHFRFVDISQATK